MAKKIFIAIIALLIVAIIAFYVYEITVNKVPYTQNLFRVIILLAGLSASLAKLITGTGGRRQPLAAFESVYKEELDGVFTEEKGKRKKLLQAIRFHHEGKYKKAVEITSSLFKTSEEKADICASGLFLARALTEMNRYYEAIEIYEKLIRLEPYTGRYYSNMGFCLKETQKTFEALECYQKAIELNPDYAHAYNNVAALFFEKGEFEEAIAYAKKALEIEPSLYPASTYLAVIYTLNENEEEAKKYSHMAISSGRNPNELKNIINYYKSAFNKEQG